MKSKRKRISKKRPVVINKIGMEIRLNITMEVMQGDEIIMGDTIIAAKGGDDMIFITPYTDKRQLSRELGRVTSKYKIVVVDKFNTKG
jgi:hypothetical protein